MAVNGSLFDHFFTADSCPKKDQDKRKIGKGERKRKARMGGNGEASKGERG